MFDRLLDDIARTGRALRPQPAFYRRWTAFCIASVAERRWAGAVLQAAAALAFASRRRSALSRGLGSSLTGGGQWLAEPRYGTSPATVAPPFVYQFSMKSIRLDLRLFTGFAVVAHTLAPPVVLQGAGGGLQGGLATVASMLNATALGLVLFLGKAQPSWPCRLQGCEFRRPGLPVWRGVSG